MTGRFAYRKRWGAELLGGKDVRFSLWAPGAEELWLVGGRDCQAVPLTRGADGWFEIETDRIVPGDSYAFRLADGKTVPDPAARAQAGSVHEPSRLVDPRAYEWRCDDWQGRPWEEAVVYELHSGTFTEEGTFAGVQERLAHLAETGVTAIELMPVAQFGGDRGWGYDGVLLYAPHRAYGGPERLKALVDAAHQHGLMVLLDVVYNHFGPDGNYLHLYAPEFFDPGRHTPWGAAIAYDRPPVRDFFVDNALFWLEEYRFDGLRLDAINEIHDPSPEHILVAIAKAVRARMPDRHVHLTTEDHRNITYLHERDGNGAPKLYTAEWNDDFHHVAHVIATNETEGYYLDYATDRMEKLARALAEGYVYQGDPSRFWGEDSHGVPCAHLPPPAFVNFIQNHDQIGNRAFNERLTDLVPARVVEALTATLLLSPAIPLLFMGEEWGEVRAFGFFTDFDGELATAVREGRRREFARFDRFADEANRERIPDPNAESTFLSSRLDWERLKSPEGQQRQALVTRLLRIRREEIVPRLERIGGHCGKAKVGDGSAIAVAWRMGDGATLSLIANLGSEPCAAPLAPEGRVLFESAPGIAGQASSTPLPGWSVVALLDDG